MPFDLSTATPVDGGFDLASAKPEKPKFNFKTWKENNWGTGADKAAYDAGGKIAEIAARLGLPAPVAGGLGYAANVGMQAVPMLLAGEAAKNAAPMLEQEAASLMRRAIKPTVKQNATGDAPRAIQTMLDEGISVSKGGMEKLQGKISGLNDQITDAIANSTARVPVEDAGQHLMNTFDKFKNQVNPTGDLNAIRSTWDEFKNHPDLVNQADMPVQLAQKLKQGTYGLLSKKYNGEVGTASDAAQKSIARGLKDEIATAVPGVGPLNAQESELINALKVAGRAVNREGNKNPLGLSLLGGTVPQAAGFALDRSGFIKSLLARMLYSGSEQIPATAARAGAGLLTSVNNQP